MCVIALPLMNISTGKFDTVVNAEILHDIAPHLSAVLTVAVHRNPWLIGMWSTSDVETGQRIGAFAPTRGLAIMSARDCLADKTVGDTEAAFRLTPAWARMKAAQEAAKATNVAPINRQKGKKA